MRIDGYQLGVLICVGVQLLNLCWCAVVREPDGVMRQPRGIYAWSRGAGGASGKSCVTLRGTASRPLWPHRALLSAAGDTQHDCGCTQLKGKGKVLKRQGWYGCACLGEWGCCWRGLRCQWTFQCSLSQHWRPCLISYPTRFGSSSAIPPLPQYMPLVAAELLCRL